MIKITSMAHIEEITSNFLKFIEFGKDPLNWDQINEELKVILRKTDISDALKLILTSTGSVTKALEVISNANVKISTRFQKVKIVNGLEDNLCNLLNLDHNDYLNFREVWLHDAENQYVFAMSLTPIKRLEDGFKEDLMRADTPIGRIIVKHNVECRREIYHISSIKHKYLNELGVKWKDVAEEDEVPYRTYNIISQGRILICIVEFFYPKL